MSDFKCFQRQSASRRAFLKTGAITLTTVAIASKPKLVHAAGTDEIKVALIGCGARGAGAAVQALSTAGPVKLWAMADAFQDRLDSCLNNMERGFAASYDRDASQGVGSRIDVSPERRFIGLDAYKKAIDSGVDVVILTEPPGFRPKHFEYAVNAGKHVFMEKPVATDVHGVKRVLSAARAAKEKGLKVGVGLQRRHQPSYHEALQQFRDGSIGNVSAMRCYWNTGTPAKTPIPRNDMTELEYQVRNWYFFTWLSGDHICEQHVHNLDVCNWFKGEHPAQAQGQGGRQVRTGKEYGTIYDHHFVEFTYDDGVKLYSQCRQIPGCWSLSSEAIDGTDGTLTLSIAADISRKGARAWKSARPKKGLNPYQIEHDVLFDAIRNGGDHNEAEYGAVSSMTGILGRMATYTGKIVTWDQAMNSNEKLTTDADGWDAAAPVTVDEDGRYPVAIPGVSNIV